MNSILAAFVGSVGPGQVVDRHSLAVVPVGFLKIGIYNDVRDLCLFIGDFREGLEESNLDLKLSIKAELWTGGEVFYGVNTARGRTAVNNETKNDVTMIKFNKVVVNGNIVREINENNEWEDEMLQVQVHAWRKTARMPIKSHIGVVHIKLNDVTMAKTPKFNSESWYKVFPNSSVCFGYLSNGLQSCYVNPPSSSSSTPASKISPEMLERMNSFSVTDTDNAPSTSSSSCGNNGVDHSKKNTFKNVAKALAKLMQKRTTEQCDGEEAKNNKESKERFPKKSKVFYQPRTWHSFNDRTLFNKPQTRERSGLFRNQSSLFENFIKFKLQRNISKTATLANQPTFRRCQEVICSPGVIRKAPESDEIKRLSFEYVDYHTSSVQKRFNRNSNAHSLKPGRCLRFKQNSLESTSGESSGIETDDNISMPTSNVQPERKLHKSFSRAYLWDNKRATIHDRARSYSLYTAASPSYSEKEEADDADENVYHVLKYLQTIPKSSNSEKPCQKQSSKSSDIKRTNSQDEAENFQIVEAILSTPPRSPLLSSRETPHLPASVSLSRDSESSTTIASVCSSGESEAALSHCRREKFSKHRSIAIDQVDDDKLSFSSCQSSEKWDSDDDYMTCCEKLSSTNLSMVSSYTLANEKPF